MVTFSDAVAAVRDAASGDAAATPVGLPLRETSEVGGGWTPSRSASTSSRTSGATSWP